MITKKELYKESIRKKRARATNEDTDMECMVHILVSVLYINTMGKRQWQRLSKLRGEVILDLGVVRKE